MLEHHLEEEEEDLFPTFKEYSARSTRKKMGTVFRKEREKHKSKREEQVYRETV